MITEYYSTVRQFYGFYESIYYHSDMEYDYNECMLDDKDAAKGKHYELTKFKQYQKAVCKEWVEQLKGFLRQSTASGRVIRKIRFKRLESPRYYNFETDKLVMSVDFNLTNLKRWCFAIKPHRFDKYLRKNYTSYDGFCSFIPNDIEKFKHKYFDECQNNKERENENLINVMLEFYFETQVDFVELNAELIHQIDEILPVFMTLVKD